MLIYHFYCKIFHIFKSVTVLCLVYVNSGREERRVCQLCSAIKLVVGSVCVVLAKIAVVAQIHQVLFMCFFPRILLFLSALAVEDPNVNFIFFFHKVLHLFSSSFIWCHDWLRKRRTLVQRCGGWSLTRVMARWWIEVWARTESKAETTMKLLDVKSGSCRWTGWWMSCKSELYWLLWSLTQDFWVTGLRVQFLETSKQWIWSGIIYFSMYLMFVSCMKKKSCFCSVKMYQDDQNFPNM